MIYNFIRAIADNKVTPKVHGNFTRYSLGDYEKESFKIKKSRDITIKAGFEWVPYLQMFFADQAQETLELSGAIETIRDIHDDLTSLGLIYTSKRRFGKQGTKFEFTTQTITPKTYKELIKRCFGDYILTSVKGSFGMVKIKSSSTPKVNSATENFITLKFPLDILDEIKKQYLYDVDKEFSTAVIKHIYHITNIKVNEKLLKEDPQQARKMAKRIGTITRIITLDDEEILRKEIKMNV